MPDLKIYEGVIGLEEIHLNKISIEEDAGKSIHDADSTNTGIDLNRVGIALRKIISDQGICQQI